MYQNKLTNELISQQQYDAALAADQQWAEFVASVTDPKKREALQKTYGPNWWLRPPAFSANDWQLVTGLPTAPEYSECVEISGGVAQMQEFDPVPGAAAAVRAERDERIAAVRWRIERYDDEVALGRETTTDTAETITTIREYVQLLRDVPLQDGFPMNPDWPELSV